MTARRGSAEMESFPDLLKAWIGLHVDDLARDGIQATLTEGPGDRNRTAAWVDLDSGSRLLRLTVWESGEAVLSMADAATDTATVVRQLEFTGTSDLDRAIAAAVAWSREPLAASRENIREYWSAYRDRANIERVASKTSPSVVLDLIALYRTLSLEEQNEINGLLAEQLSSDDATLRFDSMAVIQEFKIRSAVPSLVELTVRLEGQAGPQARNELAKARALIDEFD